MTRLLRPQDRSPVAMDFHIIKDQLGTVEQIRAENLSEVSIGVTYIRYKSQRSLTLRFNKFKTFLHICRVSLSLLKT